MKQIQQIATIALISLLTFNLSGCSEKDEPATTDTERGIALESISAILQGMDSNGETTRATQAGFSVNTEKDPTKVLPQTRSWKMDFTLYNGNNKYDNGSFDGQDCIAEKWGESGKFFPNYKKPQAEALIYPNGWNSATPISKLDQSGTDGSDLLAQDILIRDKADIEVAHKITIEVKHKHSMLDFVIKNVVKADIASVEVLVDATYTPYPVKETAVNGSTTVYDLEYMLILPENTSTSPVVQIKTNTNTGTGINAITYKQTIGIISNGKTELGSNKCYCFTLQGAELKISPVTVLNWATGESLPGEYIAVTAYPTFKAEGHANETYYFYYDNKLKEGDKAKLQEIKFNENAECTIKPDGRILTHIYKPNDVEAIAESKNMTPKAGSTPTTANIVLSQMIIDLQSKLPTIP